MRFLVAKNVIGRELFGLGLGEKEILRRFAPQDDGQGRFWCRSERLGEADCSDVELSVKDLTQRTQSKAREHGGFVEWQSVSRGSGGVSNRVAASQGDDWKRKSALGGEAYTCVWRYVRLVMIAIAIFDWTVGEAASKIYACHTMKLRLWCGRKTGFCW
jgi:hypothetical protein